MPIFAKTQSSSTTHAHASAHASAALPALPHAALTAAVFVLLSALPWLNPFSGGAVTPAIPLLVGWGCCALLLALTPAQQLPWAWSGLLALCGVASVWGLLVDAQWQLLAVGLLMMLAAATVARRMFLPDGNGAALLAWSWLLAGVLNACIGFLQYKQSTAWLGSLVNHPSAGQVYGNLRQRNQFASLMAIALWALWFLWQQGYVLRALCRVWANVPAWTATALAWVLMAVLCTSMAMTLSRTGLLQLVFTVFVLFFVLLKRSPTHVSTDVSVHISTHAPSHKQVLCWVLGVAVVYAVASYALPFLRGGSDMLERLSGQDSRACIGRTVLWGNVWQLIQQKPLWGWGWGELDFAHYHADYPHMRFCDMLDNAHNLPLHLAVELGLPVAVLVCVGLAGWFVRSKPWAEHNPARQMAWGVLLVIGLHSLVEYPLWYAHFQLAFGLAVGLLLVVQPQRQPEQALEPASRQKEHANSASVLLQQTLAAFLLAGMAYASFDFVRVTQLYTNPEHRLAFFKGNTMEHAQRSWLFRNAVLFARVSMVPVTVQNAQQMLLEAQHLMHYSPEARVAKRIIECLQVLGRDSEAEQAAAQFRSAYPAQYAQWVKEKENREKE